MRDARDALPARPADAIRVRGADENNLRHIDVDIPHGRIVVVTGVSGSGKSSLAFDVVFREAQRRYLETFSAYARLFMGKLRRPEVAHIEGLAPAIAVSQRAGPGGPRSTVGTLTELHDFLRLLFARLGEAPPGVRPTRSLFSFNSPEGACPACRGLGVEDRIDPELLVGDPSKTLREGALVLTTPNGYIIYSQVTMEVLDRVCRAHGFSVDLPWRDLTEEQRDVVLNGSRRVLVPFGKHPLESRLRWTGITAKPREESRYKGILPVMDAILRQKRNKNILRFARTLPCRACGGKRLRPEALAVSFRGRDIAALSALSVRQLDSFFRGLEFGARERAAGEAIRGAVLERAGLLLRLGLGHLALDRESGTLSPGETSRIKLAAQAAGGLRGVLYVLDEPTVGLHPSDTERLLDILRALRDAGNTVLVVEHDEAVVRAADHLIDLGPGAGEAGGRVLFSGPPDALVGQPRGASPTRDFLAGDARHPVPATRRPGSGDLEIRGARLHNLRSVRVAFRLGAFNVVTGVSGAGKTTLVRHILAARLRAGKLDAGPDADGLRVDGRLAKVVEIDASPIGRTPRSNPATYTKLGDAIRDLFAALPGARERGFGKGRFSFNVKGGRCEACEGAGLQQVGMHFLGDVDVVCPVCEGRRFNDETLGVKLRGKSVADVFEMSVAAAAEFFSGEPRLRRVLDALASLGLGYLRLGQSSTTLSGGEAQRVKLAAELARPEAGATLYVLDEPTTGLHARDVGDLLAALQALVDKGNTIVAVEHHPDVIRAADHVVDLGPGSGEDGGRVVVEGTPEEVAARAASLTGAALGGRPGPGMPGGEAEGHGSARPAGLLSAKPGADDSPHIAAAKTETGPKALPASREEPHIAPSSSPECVTNDQDSGGAAERGPDGTHPGPDGPITLRGVSTHNLRDLDIDIPFRRFTVITGPSGSGKSSLAFDTLFAESRRRFVESFSAYVRALLGAGARADLASAWGLTPPIAISRRAAAGHPRSTVGTTTEIYEYYRLLYARAGALPPGVDRADVSASLFSFNHEKGACPRCGGLGSLTVCDPDKLVTHPEKPLIDGALDGTKTGRFYGDPHGQYVAALLAAGKEAGVDFAAPWASLGDDARRLAMSGTGERAYDVVWAYKRGRRAGDFHFRGPWKGFVSLVGEEYARKHADRRGEAMLPLMKEEACPACGGKRLRPEALAVTFLGRDIAALAAMTVGESIVFFEGEAAAAPLEPKAKAVTEAVRGEILRRLYSVRDAGLTYLSLDRGAGTLSGGESQRLRLASLLGARLMGVTYVLDEPTTGLHPRDTERLVGALKELVAERNTVVVVEHDADVIRAADRVFDLGPGAGPSGGRLVAEGTPAELAADPESPTGRFLARTAGSAVPCAASLGPGVTIRGARAHNLRGIDVEIPSGGLVAVTGVSGSGKTSLVFDVLQASAGAGRPVACDAIEGLERFARVTAVDQDLPAGGGSSTPATFAGVFDEIRSLFAATPEARERGFGKAHFSYLTKEGRCETCGGTGEARVALDFLADMKQPCETCGGRRYKAGVLEVRLDGRSAADVLDLTIGEARAAFAGRRGIERPLKALEETGLGYLQLGQPLGTLSGGELQRLKLGLRLGGGAAAGPTLFLLDEPTTGLHFVDVERLMGVFERLIGLGHTVVVVEHNLDIIARAHRVIDLGPEGGDGGGRVVAAGPPAAIAACTASWTGAALKKLGNGSV